MESSEASYPPLFIVSKTEPTYFCVMWLQYVTRRLKCNKNNTQNSSDQLAHVLQTLFSCLLLVHFRKILSKPSKDIFSSITSRYGSWFALDRSSGLESITKLTSFVLYIGQSQSSGFINRYCPCWWTFKEHETGALFPKISS